MSDKRLRNFFRKEVRPHRLFLRRRESKASLQLHLSGSDVGPHLLAELTSSSASERRKGHQPLRRFFRALRHDAPAGAGAPPPAAAVPPSSELARDYDIGREVGAGASGAVNVARARASGRVYALKRLRRQLPGEPRADYSAKVRNEYVIGEHLRHQNLIRTVRMFEENDGADHYILMEYCPFDFFNLVMCGLMGRREILCYLRQLVHGVAHLHAAGIAHRDLKLDNCVVDAHGVVKLVDFGLAFQFRRPHPPHTPPPPHTAPLGPHHVLVYARGVVGSDPYLSPEVLANAPYDPRAADVWSLAIIFCCMVLRRFPWKLPRTADPSFRAFAGLDDLDQPVLAQDRLATAVSELSVHKTPVPKYGPDRLLALLPSALRGLLGAMLALDPAARASVEDIVADPFFQSIEYCHYAVPVSDNQGDNGDNGDNGDIQGDPAAAAADGTSHLAVYEAVDVPREVENGLALQLSSTSPTTSAQSDEPWSADGAPFVAALHHKHHLVTAEELEKLTKERERARQVKQTLS